MWRLGGLRRFLGPGSAGVGEGGVRGVGFLEASGFGVVHC
jgi:hypothetical protein